MFRSADEFFDTIENYLGTRMINGKFILDLYKQFKKLLKIFRDFLIWLYKTKMIHALLVLIYKLFIKCIGVSVIAKIGEVLIDACKIMKKHIAVFWIIFAFISIPSSLILLSFIQSSIASFFTFLLPILVINLICISIYIQTYKYFLIIS